MIDFIRVTPLITKILNKIYTFLGVEIYIFLFGIFGLYQLGKKNELLELIKDNINKKNKGKYIFYKKKIIFKILIHYQEPQLVLNYFKKNIALRIANLYDIKIFILSMVLCKEIDECFALFNKIKNENLKLILYKSIFILSNSEEKRIGEDLEFLRNNILFFKSLAISFLQVNKLNESKLIADYLVLIEEELLLEDGLIYNYLSVDPWTSSIGHFIWVDLIFQAVNFGLIKRNEIYLESNNKVSNFELHKRYYKLLKSSSNQKLNKTANQINKNALSIRYNKEIISIYDLFDRINKRPDRRNLISSKEEKLKKDRIELEKKFGLPRQAWYATLHVREDNFRFDPLGFSGSNRSANIDDYKLLIKVIVDSGGYVVRCGDSTMKPIEMSNVIDYANSKFKSSSIDISILESALFHVGTNSGLSYIPLLFNLPTIYTNDFPLCANLSRENCISLPKHIKCKLSDKYLNVHDLANFEMVSMTGYLEDDKYIVEDNDPEVLRDMMANYINNGFLFGFGTKEQLEKICTAYQFSNIYRKNFIINISGFYRNFKN
jgi:putative glycosyltransferase (TIGR04372 family)